MTNTTNHKALITGGSRGIGAAIASVIESQVIQIIAPKRSKKVKIGGQTSW
jgi:3-oxoacyl-[acyl-carrier protein] reductase